MRIKGKSWLTVLHVSLVFGFFYFEVVVPSSFAESDLPDSPVSIVRKFCQHDFDGARLSGSTYSLIQDIIAYEAEPGWDSAVVVSDFQIEVSRRRKGEYVVPVKYHLLGVLDGWAWTSIQDKENVPWSEETKKNFQIIRDRGRFKIAGPVFRPHISIDAALRTCLEALLSYEKGLNNDGQEQDLRRTIAVLKELLKQKRK